MVFCKSCGVKVEPGTKFCENCGASVDDQPVLLTPQSPDSQGPAVGIANQFVGRFPLYTIIGICGVALLILSLLIPFIKTPSTSNNFINLILGYITGRFKLSIGTSALCTAIIGTVGGIIGLKLHSWKVQVISGLLFLLTPIILIIINVGSLEYLQISWVIVTLLGGVLLVIAGLIMRNAGLSGTRS